MIIIRINHVCLGEARWRNSPPKVKYPNFIFGQTYGSAMKVCESVGRRCEACGGTPEIRIPNKHTGFDKLKLEGCPMG